MPGKKYLDKPTLTESKHLQTLVENRRVYKLNNCEFNVFESYEQAYRVPLTFSDFVITSMIRGKKVMHLFDQPAFEYLPGESVIVPPNETMVIDFPEADFENPTQCIALALDRSYIKESLQYLNQYYNSDQDEKHDWKLQFNQYHFVNETEITNIINKLIRICGSPDRAKNIYADLNLKELLIRLMQSQHIQQINAEKSENSNHTRLHFVLHYIHEHLTEKILIDMLCRKAYMSRNMFFMWFREQFGVSPLEYINKERIKLAKQLLADHRNNITAVSMKCGFLDVNYFVRLFRKYEGLTPGAYQICTGIKKNDLSFSE
jgi:AraC-like DNA-binding protein